MTKYIFNNLERFVVWNTYGCKCFWCGEPLPFKDITIDHVLPEDLIEKPDEFQRIKINYQLQDDFDINNFCNWVPSHSNCNSRKSRSVFENSPAMIFILHKLYSKAKDVHSSYNKLQKRQDKDKIIGKLLAELEIGKISDYDLIVLLKQINSRHAWKFQEIEKDKLTFVPKGWEIMSENKNKRYLSITNGVIAATVPTDIEPDRTWFCYNCKNYGPWMGNRCVNCGYLGDID